jgi:hypothetical protein
MTVQALTLGNKTSTIFAHLIFMHGYEK